MQSDTTNVYNSISLNQSVRRSNRLFLVQKMELTVFLCAIVISSLASTDASSGQAYRRTPEDVELTTFFTRLWNDDGARLGKAVASSDIRIDIGGRTRDSETKDEAPRYRHSLLGLLSHYGL